MKGIVFAYGDQIYPLANLVDGQSSPTFGRPLIYYPISLLMAARVREILIICSPKYLEMYKGIFDDGSHYNLNISYSEQTELTSPAEALVASRDFIGTDSIVLIFGDNLFFGRGFHSILKEFTVCSRGATLLGFPMSAQSARYGIVELDILNRVCGFGEHCPISPSIRLVAGVYFYDNEVIDIAANINPSIQGLLTITEINRAYLARGDLHVKLTGRGIVWLDKNAHQTAIKALKAIRSSKKKQSYRIVDLDEILVS